MGIGQMVALGGIVLTVIVGLFVLSRVQSFLSG